LPDVAAAFCLHCGAVRLDGERLDVEGTMLV